MKYLIVLALLLGSAGAQQTCPVEVNKASSHHNLFVGFTNVGDKQLRALKFEATWIDAVGDTHSNPTTFTANDKAKPGHKGNATWANWWNNGNAKGGVKIVLIKAVFSDESSWEDDGSKSCSFTGTR